MLNPSEMEDFEAAIIKAGFEAGDFNPVAQADDPTAIEQYVRTGTVTVYRKSTDIAKEYRAGSGSTWPQDFEADLIAGEFGRP